MSSDLIQWRSEMERFKREIDKMYDRFLDWGPFRRFVELGDWVPPIDIAETSKEIIIHAEIPGMEAEDIDVSLEGSMLTVRGERKKENLEEDQDFYRAERSYGTFSRSIRLPADIDPDNVKASYHQGVLEVRLQKAEKETRKKIQVETGK